MQDKFKEFNNKIVLDEKCQKHNVNLWKIKVFVNGEQKEQVMCYMCAKENIENKEKDNVNRILKERELNTTYRVFERDSIVPEKLKQATFKNYVAKTKEEKDLLVFFRNQTKKYITGMTGNTLVTGTTGIGKSHLSYALAKNINETFYQKNKPKSVLFVTFTDIVSKIQNSWDKKSDNNFTNYEAVELLSKVDYLVLDDLGAKNSILKPKSDWEQDLLFDILNKRENTIINTNLSSEELAMVYNERNYSRIIKGLKGNSFKADKISDKRFEGV